jgi:DNA-binding NarL/FixJ family response regulator
LRSGPGHSVAHLRLGKDVAGIPGVVIQLVPQVADEGAHQFRLSRILRRSRKPQEDNEDDSLKVKQTGAPAPARPGRRRIKTWESELLRMAASGMGVKTIARVLKGQGAEISHATVANRLREIKGQLRLIS